MQSKLFFPIVLLMACCLAASPAIAQEDTPKGQLISIHQDLVIPSMVEKYEKAAKNLADMITKNNVSSISYTAASSQEFVYLYISPVENMAAIDKMGGSWDELQKKVGKQAFDDAMKQFDGCYTSHTNYIMRMRPELSYNPDYGAQLSSGILFRHWDFYYIHPGMEEEAGNIAKEWVALSKKVGMPEGYRLYSSGFGADGPLFVVTSSAKSAKEFYARQEEWMKKAGAEAQALMAKTWRVVRKFESADGMMRPDISVLPKEITKK